VRWLFLLAGLAGAGCGRIGFGDATVSGGDGGAGDGNAPGDSGGGALPLVWFKFDEPTGAGTYLNSGTLTVQVAAKVTQGVQGQLGRAVSLAMPTDGVTVDDQPPLDGFVHLTVEGWMYFDGFNAVNYSNFAKKEQAYILRTCDLPTCGPGRTISWIVFDSAAAQHGCNGSITPVTGTWYHVAGTYDGTTDPRVLKVYWDGSNLSTATYFGGTGAAFDSVNALTLGHADTNSENLTGRLDDVKVWSTTRTDAQICADAGKTWTGTACN
jgi:hypothetical protein